MRTQGRRISSSPHSLPLFFPMTDPTTSPLSLLPFFPHTVSEMQQLHHQWCYPQLPKQFKIASETLHANLFTIIFHFIPSFFSIPPLQIWGFSQLCKNMFHCCTQLHSVDYLIYTLGQSSDVDIKMPAKVLQTLLGLFIKLMPEQSCKEIDLWQVLDCFLAYKTNRRGILVHSWKQFSGLQSLEKSCQNGRDIFFLNLEWSGGIMWWKKGLS